MSASVTVDTPSGRVRGTVERGVARFLGLPYAAPLDGAGWFLPAEPVVPWTGERDATGYGPTVPKPGYQGPVAELLADEPDFPGPECLNVNVWSPGVDGAAPVVVWIHGGAFRNGSNRSGTYDGAAFARDGVVFVGVNYRLGALGFLDTGDEHTNLGLRDQLAALQWVRENIAAFGGDPSRVTVMGESAGAMSVACLLSSPLSAGLFSQAVMQSGAGHHALRRTTAQTVARELAARLGIEPTREAFAGVPIARVIAESQAIDLEVRSAPDPKWGEIALNTMVFEPVVGDDVLPALPIDSIRAGAGADVRVLIGRNADEGRFFIVPGGVIDQIPEPMALGIAAAYGFADPAATVAAYRGSENLSAGEVFTALLADYTFTLPALRLAEARDGAPSDTYVYRFDQPSTALDGRLGATHAVEIAFVFDTLAAATALTGPGAPQALADEMHAAWVRFLRGEDPGWAPFAEARAVRVFGGAGGISTDPDAAARALWDGVR
ncbi:carboxylesterase/lipase family protein [Tsukamurella sp. PLM1]|uniref:carboxylesterase/lipase family protein n=1 Tax=Tsukamurella sp. PLM1 TaxID=2929795 RepID=UPI00204BC239|nr:carboxylesterase family protein [Tsukamurella sp. PLM1]BDH59715.1 carboxylic ester hydrolase [Tsukamurella sp. PLM1]